MAVHYPDLTPEQLAVPVRPGVYRRRITRCGGGSFDVFVTVVSVNEVTGLCLVRELGRYTWWASASHLRARYHPVAGACG